MSIGLPMPVPILSTKGLSAPSSGIPFIPWRNRSRAPQPQPPPRAKNDAPFRLRWQRHSEHGRRSSPPPPLPGDALDLAGWSWRCPKYLEQTMHHHPPAEVEDGGRSVCFYRNVSFGSASARIPRALNNGRFYWELHLGDRMFGTSIMVGVGTEAVRGDCHTYKNLIGEDEHGWGLSHKGVVWHAGQWSPYTDPFPQNQAAVIGVLFDGVAGTLGFFKDDRWLGVAFTGLDKVTEPLYPMVACTARNTKMTLLSARRELGSLMERSRSCLLRHLPRSRDARYLPLPPQLQTYVLNGEATPVTLPATNPAHRLLI